MIPGQKRTRINDNREQVYAGKDNKRDCRILLRECSRIRNFECKAKGAFRKDGIKPLVGDDAVIEVLDEKEMTGNIIEILPRKNELIRPAVANIDQALVVFAVTKPKPHYNLLDRFLVMMERKEIPVVLCFNKTDIASHPEIAELKEVYTGCGYPVIFTSAKEEENISELKSLLKGKTTSIAGPSGVGKSSLINLLQSEVKMETGSISKKIDRGKHTTRHSELIVIGEDSYIMDTPGFSSLYVNDFEKEDLKYYFRNSHRLKDSASSMAVTIFMNPDAL